MEINSKLTIIRGCSIELVTQEEGLVTRLSRLFNDAGESNRRTNHEHVGRVVFSVSDHASVEATGVNKSRLYAAGRGKSPFSSIG